VQAPTDRPVVGTGGDADRDRAEPAVPSVTSAALLQGGRLLVIHHGQDAYRLAVTRGGKLILTK
jgi:hemin uptake protein HemP